YLSLAALSIVLSWALIHTIFALHYARAYYSAPGPGGAGLVFPGEDRPDYWDFLYFAFVIGMTFQVSDVQITDRGFRRTVLCHGIISFLFVIAILSMAVNLGANLI